MDQILLNPTLLTALLSLLFLCIITKRLSKSNKNFPPSPPKLPIIGNLHQLGSLPHRSLRSLSQKHGPLMLLHLGSAPVLVVSSADAAREIMKTHDLAFASRPSYKVFEKLLYNCTDVTTAPYSEYWRQVKSVLVLQVLSSKRVQSFRPIREEETALFIQKIRESSGAVDLSKMLAELSYDGICRAAFGRKYSGTENGKKFLVLMTEMMEVFGMTNIGDFIPWLGWIGRVNGFYERVDRAAKEMDDILESVIHERMEISETREEDGENFADILLAIYKDKTSDFSIDRDSLKALILDAFIGGTDTTATTLEWVMAELLRHPAAMEKLQKEVREIVKDKHEISDDDLEKMHYLKAVIKESLRLHPPAPTLVPRVASENVKIKGYDVSAGTVVMINAWAIGRDPASWDQPEIFKPERFLNSSTDFRGLDFEFIPFGAGRRGCPGITFAVVTIEFVLANLVLEFDWSLPNGEEGKDLDMSECPGITIHRRLPLLALASPGVFDAHGFGLNCMQKLKHSK